MKSRVLVLAAVAVLVAAGAAVATVVFSQASPAAPCTIPASVAERPTSARSAPGGGGITVAEKGVTATGFASFGAILRNTSGLIAYRTRVHLDIHITTEGSPPGPFTGTLFDIDIPVLLPGQDIGVGRPLVQIGSKYAVASAEVDIRTTTWLPAGALGNFAAVHDTYLETLRYPPEPRFDTVRYHENSPNCRTLFSRRTAVLFRDANGTLVGGDLVAPDGGGNGGPGRFPLDSPSCSPGERDTWVVPLSPIPENADNRRTQLFSYCDLTVPQPDGNQVF